MTNDTDDLARLVIPLKWRPGSYKADCGDYFAGTVLGEYSCRPLKTHWTLWFRERCLDDETGGCRKRFDELEEAKAAAQADYARRILSALDLSPAAMAAAGWVRDNGWQPIETAPKDGTEILLRLPDEDTFRGFTVWCAYWNYDCGVYGWLDDGHLISDMPFTGWTPIPAPPTDATEGQS